MCHFKIAHFGFIKCAKLMTLGIKVYSYQSILYLKTSTESFKVLLPHFLGKIIVFATWSLTQILKIRFFHNVYKMPSMSTLNYIYIIIFHILLSLNAKL